MLHRLFDYRIILSMENTMHTEQPTNALPSAPVHECAHCGELTEQHPELAGVIAYHDAAECVGGVERFQH